ncbi:5672_t:CDS:2 [Acaulospora morrowiae]|uniref:non-specific serine/threonine protein kinase n=1 Tax=Acaulospora morrowiae TaxID=94023 RepID=A0A9N8Z1P2_9GLOM|nr:5672_t:CDS:2 [Acaulospora morrowiae]
MPWFNVGLPDYLKPLPDNEVDHFTEIDNNIVTELVKKMGFSKDAIVQTLQEPENNQIKVAYQLVVDHKRMLSAGRMHDQNSIQSFLAQSPPSWDNLQRSKEKARLAEEAYENSSNITLLNSSLPTSEDSRTSMGSQHPGSSNSSFPTKRNKPRSKWHFGIRSRSPPLEVMLEIYRALKNIGMEWKTIDPFHIRCRYTYDSGLQVKIDLQLYRLDLYSYLVDFKNVGYDAPSIIAESVASSFSSPYLISRSESEISSISSHNHENTVPSNFEKKETAVSLPSSSSNGLQRQADGGKDVTSMYPFFDVCAKLITELAISS